MGAASGDREELTLRELIDLAAVDSKLYARAFFPETVPQEFPDFEDDVWRTIEGPGRLKCLALFRGSAKTTRLRLFASKRIAYGISRTIVWLGKSEGHARRSGKWLKDQVVHNSVWARAFGLQRGSPWNDTEFEILQTIPGQLPQRIYVLCLGITGSIRGINVNDRRPDLIIADDVLDEENSATPEQREKNEDLLYGAALNSLVPASEEPSAMLVALQTPLNREDFSVKAASDPSWVYLRVGCWTRETEELPTHMQVSSWPSRFPSEILRQQKIAEIARNRLSRWMREMECKISSPELCAFRIEWLQRWEPARFPKTMAHILVIDPVPPPSEKKRMQGNVTTDWEAMAVLGGHNSQYYAREISANRGHEPNWTIAEFWRLVVKYKIGRVIVETIAYQRALAWLLRESMKHRGVYLVVEEFEGLGAKYNRIVDGLSGPTSEGALFIPPDNALEGINHSEGMRMFVQQFAEYPRVANDDCVEVVAVGLGALRNKILLGDTHSADLEEMLIAEEKKMNRGRTIAPALMRAP